MAKRMTRRDKMAASKAAAAALKKQVAELGDRVKVVEAASGITRDEPSGPKPRPGRDFFGKKPE